MKNKELKRVLHAVIRQMQKDYSHLNGGSAKQEQIRRDQELIAEFQATDKRPRVDR